MCLPKERHSNLTISKPSLYKGLILESNPLDEYVDLNSVVAELKKQIPCLPSKSHFRGDHHNNKWFIVDLMLTSKNKINSSTDLDKVSSPIDLLPKTKDFLLKYFPQTRRVRVMILKPLGRIYWHYDSIESGDYGVSRIHLPIASNNQSKFVIGWSSLYFKPELIYYGDFSFPHKVFNNGSSDMIHLIIDYDSDQPHLFFKKFTFWSSKSRIFRARWRFICQFICDFYCMHRGVRDIKRFIKLYLIK